MLLVLRNMERALYLNLKIKVAMMSSLHHCQWSSYSIEWFIADRAFCRGMNWLLPSPVSKLDRRHTGRLTKRDKLLTGDGGEGWGRSQII